MNIPKYIEKALEMRNYHIQRMLHYDNAIKRLIVQNNIDMDMNNLMSMRCADIAECDDAIRQAILNHRLSAKPRRIRRTNK